MSHVIYVSDGAQEYVSVTITELTGKDISADPVWISLGTPTAPATWNTATLLVASGATVTFGLLVDSNTPVGTYTAWAKIGDGPETVVRRSDGTVTLA